MNVNQKQGLTLSDFAQMVRMSDSGSFATSLEKTSGWICADASGKIHNVRSNFGLSKGVVVQNRALREKLVEAFKNDAHVSDDFIKDVRQQLGIEGDKDARADKPLSRRTVKAILRAYTEGAYTMRSADGSLAVKDGLAQNRAANRTKLVSALADALKEVLSSHSDPKKACSRFAGRPRCPRPPARMSRWTIALRLRGS